MIKQNKPFWAVLALLSFGASYLFVDRFLALESTIYQWDFTMFWKKWLYYVEVAPHEPVEAVKVFIRHIRYSSYGDIPSVLCAPLGWAFGGSRNSYIQSVGLVLAIPAVFCGLLPLIQHFKMRGVTLSRSTLVLAWMTFLLFLPMWRPVIRGNGGAGAVALAFIVLYLWFSRSIEKQSIRNYIILGVLLALMPLYRRWMMFWVISFFLSIGVVELLPMLLRDGFKKTFAQGLRVALAGIVMVALFLFVAYPALLRMMTIGEELYNVYKHGFSAGRVFELWLWHFSPLCFIMVLWGIVSGYRNEGTRKWTLFLVLHFIVSFGLFRRMQDFAEHHYYLLVPVLALLMAIGLCDIALRIKSARLKTLWVSLLGCFMTAQFIFTFFPPAEPHLRVLKPAFAKWVAYPLERNDVEEVAQLLETLRSEVEANPSAKIYTLASSGILSDNTLRDAHLVLPWDLDLRDHILSVGHLDEIDGFPYELMTADLVVISDPPQTHLVEGKQDVVTVPVSHFLEHRGIAQHFERVPGEFKLDEGITAMVYRRVSEVSRDAAVALADELEMEYSDTPIKTLH